MKMSEEKYRTFWRRFWAGVVDGIVLLPIALLANWIWAHHAALPRALLAVVHVGTSVMYYAYSIYFLGRFGQTLGKMAMNLRVLDLSEQRHVTYLQAIRRDIVPLAITAILLPNELYQIMDGRFSLQHPATVPDTASIVSGSVAVVWFVIEVTTMMFSSKRRALHDFIAGSVVVKDKRKDEDAEPAIDPDAEPYVPDGTSWNPILGTNRLGRGQGLNPPTDSLENEESPNEVPQDTARKPAGDR